MCVSVHSTTLSNYSGYPGRCEPKERDQAEPRQAVRRMTEILLLCSANQCRSVLAESLLRRRLGEAGVSASVRSAGVLHDGGPPAPEVISALAAYGLDVTAHRGCTLSESDLARSDLVLAMAREHLRYAVVALPSAWPRAFTLKELTRRGQQIGPRPAGESLAGWLRRAHHGRHRSALLGDCADDDVADPSGGPPQAYTVTAEQLDQLLARLVQLAWGRLSATWPGRLPVSGRPSRRPARWRTRPGRPAARRLACRGPGE